MVVSLAVRFLFLTFKAGRKAYYYLLYILFTASYNNHAACYSCSSDEPGFLSSGL